MLDPDFSPKLAIKPNLIFTIGHLRTALQALKSHPEATWRPPGGHLNIGQNFDLGILQNFVGDQIETILRKSLGISKCVF